jgi:acyl-CoA thioesterase FadM
LPFTDAYTVRVSEMDECYRLEAHQLCAYFQDAIACHYADLGLAAYDLQRENRTWLLVGMRIDYLDQMPVWRTRVNVEIWPREVGRIRLYNDLIARSAAGEVIARGTSCFLIADQESRRPVPLDSYAGRLEVHDEAALPGFRFRRIAAPEGETHSLAQVVRGHDTDFNDHLNSLRTLVWALEAIPRPFRERRTLASIDVRFLQEAYYGDTIVSNVTCQGDAVYHQLLREEDGAEICRMLSTWR